jgi:ornithine cyclodeaminase/alanine dehydrogenase-like protein (mu-crystallin family)
MAIFLTEEDVIRLLPINEAVNSLEAAFIEQANGTGMNHPRSRTASNDLSVTMMVAVLGQSGFGGFKVMGSGGSMVTLYGGEKQELLAIIESRKLGQIRTGAASGVATKYMSKENSSSVGVIGTGHQAISQLTAVCAVRPIKTIKAYSRNVERREQFCREMAHLLGVEVIPVSSGQEAIERTDIAIAITNIRTLDPVLMGDWLEPGMHINAAGANSIDRRELDDIAITRSSIIAVDAKDQAALECADLTLPISSGLLGWDNVFELSHIVAGQIPGRKNDTDITLFESQGIGLEDIAVATHIYNKAKAEGSGINLPF